MRRTTPRKKRCRQGRPGALTRRRLQVVMAVGIVLSLFAAWTMLAYSGGLDSVFRQKGKKGGRVSTASFNSNIPSKEYIYAGGRLVATDEPTASTLGAPGNMRATTTSSTQIQINWDLVAGATRYELQRSSNYGGANDHGFVPVASTITGNSYPDTISTNAAYVYRVRALDAGGNASQFSNIDLATAIAFAEDPVQSGMTIKDFHILRLRDAVNYVRTAAGIGMFGSWTDPFALTQVVIKKEHVQELRDKLEDARNALGLPPATYTDQTITRYVTPVAASHIQELRRLVKGYRTVTG